MSQKYLVPVAIVVAGGLIAAGFYFGKPNPNSGPNSGNGGVEELAIAEVTADDHIKGNVDAEVVLVEYSDTSCPFCKLFHATMNNVIGSYAPDKLAWIYRHFPIPQLHPFARNEALATECAAELGGNDVFWKYTDRLYEIQTSTAQPPRPLDQDELPNVAEFAGLNRGDFQACLDRKAHFEKIDAQVADAQRGGARGTPFNILVLKNEASEATVELINSLRSQNPDVFGISPDKKRIKIAGALYGQNETLLRNIIDSILEN